jgi:cytidyltransferase-like protein
MFTGPGEMVFGILCLLLLSLFVDLEQHLLPYVNSCALFMNHVFGFHLPLDDFRALFHVFCQSLYVCVLVAIILECAWTIAKKNYASRNGLLLCLLYRGLLPLMFHYFGITDGTRLAPLSIIADGLFLSVITVDMIVAKMSDRDLHPWIVVFAMLSIMSDFITILCLIFYYITLFVEISHYMDLNMFAVTINVYVDGAYDMCHLGHINSFKVALSYGTRLFVGVLSDEAIMAYKRKPIMTMEERCAIVATSKYVHKVIPDAPGKGIPEEFLRKYRIHIVCHSWEYDKPNDHYYAVPRKMGITRVTPRTEGVSTSALIKRCVDYGKTGGENKQETQWKEEKEAIEDKATMKTTTKK